MNNSATYSHYNPPASFNLKIVTADYNIDAATDYTILADNSSGVINFILPDSTVNANKIFIISRINHTSTGYVTVDTTFNHGVQDPATGTFPTGGSVNLADWGAYNQSVMYQSDGNLWYAIK